MKPIPLMPLAGMNLVAEDAALQRGGDSPRLFVRDAVNVDVSPAGKPSLRAGTRRVTEIPYRDLWQSPLHRDTFGMLAGQWVKIDPLTWSSEVLAAVGDGDVSHEVLNNLVCVAAPAGIFTFDGARAARLTLDTPAAPLVLAGAGSMSAGTYGVAVAWLRGALESAPSAISFTEVGNAGALEITPPMCLDASVTGMRLYLTRPNGGELAHAGDHAVGGPGISMPRLPDLGRPPQFINLSPMPTGKYLKYWRGRLLTAKANVLRFSEALTYHLHDERHGFVQMPQRITFVQPVDGGIWVGQVDHVAFLEGSAPETLNMVRKTARAPVPGSAMLVDSDTMGADLSQGGGGTAIWLAENGYVAGTQSGQVAELQAGVMRDITARSGTSVVFDRRLLTAVV